MHNFTVLKEEKNSLIIEFSLNGGVNINKAYEEALNWLCNSKDEDYSSRYHYYDVKNIVLTGIEPTNTRDNDGCDTIDYRFNIQTK